MQGIWEKNSNGDSREVLRLWRMEIAVTFAVLSHLVLILLPGFSIQQSGFNPTVFNIQLQEEAIVEEPEEEIKDQSTLEDDVIEKQSTDKQTEPQPSPQPKSTKPIQATEPKFLVQENEKAPMGRILSYDNIKRFAESETQHNTPGDQGKLDQFSDTFMAPKAEVLKDTVKTKDALGGGAYKVRKNGVECVVLKMMPQSFDEMNSVGTISGSGRCVDKNKKMTLLDENGKILNSDRFD